MAEKVKDWLTEAHDYAPPHRGEIREGILLELDEQGAIVDIGLKHDGIVPRQDLEHLDEKILSDLEPGQEVTTQVTRADDKDGSLFLSLSYVQEEKDWQKAQAAFERDEIWQGSVLEYNRGGLLAKFGQIEAFVPASHLWQQYKQKKPKLKQYIGQELSLKFIEVNRETNRLIASERRAKEQLRRQKLETLLAELVRGDVRRGVVSHLVPYGAFVDLGGAEGLIHISEISWQHIQHPHDVLQVGDEIDVYILDLDHQRKRISLSLRRLHPDPWALVDSTYYIDQLVSGTVTNVVDFGAFVALESGVEGLIHISELTDLHIENPREIVQPGDEVVAKIITIDSPRQRMGLSLKAIEDWEREDWIGQQSSDD
jgi:small subunit ribosomal protein S1